MENHNERIDIDHDYLDMMNHNFTHAIDNNMELVYMGYYIVDDNYIKEMWVEKKNWNKALDVLIDGASKIEEYEYAIKFKKMKDII